MMKRVIILMVLVLGLLGTSLGYAEDGQEKASRDLLGKYTDMKYALEAGITKVDFDKYYRDLYIATQKYKDNIATDIYKEFISAMNSYNDIGIMWNGYGQVYRYNDIKNMLTYEYPNIKNEVSSDIWGQYRKRDVVAFLFGEANNKTRALEKLIENKYPKKIEESK